MLFFIYSKEVRRYIASNCTCLDTPLILTRVAIIQICTHSY